MNQSLDLGMMTNHSIWSPPDKSLLSTLTGNQGNSIPGDNMDKIRY
jgi:hypothetical protein